MSANWVSALFVSTGAASRLGAARQWYRAIDVVTGKNQTAGVPCITARRIGQCGYDDPKFLEAKDCVGGFA